MACLVSPRRRVLMDNNCDALAPDRSGSDTTQRRRQGPVLLLPPPSGFTDGRWRVAPTYGGMASVDHPSRSLPDSNSPSSIPSPPPPPSLSTPPTCTPPHPSYSEFSTYFQSLSWKLALALESLRGCPKNWRNTTTEVTRRRRSATQRRATDAGPDGHVHLERRRRSSFDTALPLWVECPKEIYFWKLTNMTVALVTASSALVSPPPANPASFLRCPFAPLTFWRV